MGKNTKVEVDFASACQAMIKKFLDDNHESLSAEEFELLCYQAHEKLRETIEKEFRDLLNNLPMTERGTAKLLNQYRESEVINHDVDS